MTAMVQQSSAGASPLGDYNDADIAASIKARSARSPHPAARC
jgi:hypothetical protein